MQPFIGRQPVDWFKHLYWIYDVFYQILSKNECTYFVRFVFCFLVFHWGQGTMWSRHNHNVTVWEDWIAFCVVLVLEIYFYGKKNLSSPFVLFNAFKAVGSPDKVLSKTQPLFHPLSTNQSQTFSKSLFGCFSISSTSLRWYVGHHSSAYKNRFGFTAWHVFDINKEQQSS